MHSSRLLTLLSLLMLLALQGCSSQMTPAEVAQNFWDAVVANDTEKLNQYVAKNTLEDPGLLSNKDKTLTAVEIGAITTEANRAEAVTTLIGSQNDKEIRLPVTTYMVMEEDQWKVNGQQSVNALVSASVNLMMNDISGNFSELSQALGDSISGGLQEFITSFNKEVPNIKEGLSQLSDEEKTRDIGRKLGQLFSQGLNEAMGELNKGLEEISKELDTATQEAPPQQPGN